MFELMGEGGSTSESVCVWESLIRLRGWREQRLHRRGACGWRDEEAFTSREKDAPQAEQYARGNRAWQRLVCLRNRAPSLGMQHKVGRAREEGSGAQVFFPFLEALSSLTPSSPPLKLSSALTSLRLGQHETPSPARSPHRQLPLRPGS